MPPLRSGLQRIRLRRIEARDNRATRNNGKHYNLFRISAMQFNPSVTVRSRGVMEKCSYCIQRINHARIEAKVQDLPLSKTGLVSACQQACPTAAIEFGDLNDPEAKVTHWRNSDLAYGILTELGTRPRTMYLKRVSNPNPELVRS